MKARHLLIALGGMGGRTLLDFRRALDAQPRADMPELRYLYLDAEEDVVSQAAWQQHAADIPFLNLKKEARALNEMEQNPALRPWVDSLRWKVAEQLGKPVYEADAALSRLPGAGRWRRYGRALFLHCREAVLRLLQPLVEEVGTRGLTVHVFFSAGGGTGSGAAMDMLSLLQKLAMRVPGRFVLLPYVYMGGEEKAAGSYTANRQQLMQELAKWLEEADEDTVPHCYLASEMAPGTPTPEAQTACTARALLSGLQLFLRGEYYAHLYDSIPPRKAAPGDRFATLGQASAADPAAALEQLHGLSRYSPGKGPRNTLLAALPMDAANPFAGEQALELLLEETFPLPLHEQEVESISPTAETQFLLLQHGLSPAQPAVFDWLRQQPADEAVRYFARLDDSGD